MKSKDFFIFQRLCKSLFFLLFLGLFMGSCTQGVGPGWSSPSQGSTVSSSMPISISFTEAVIDVEVSLTSSTLGLAAAVTNINVNLDPDGKGATFVPVEGWPVGNACVGGVATTAALGQTEFEICFTVQLTTPGGIPPCAPYAHQVVDPLIYFHMELNSGIWEIFSIDPNDADPASTLTQITFDNAYRNRDPHKDIDGRLSFRSNRHDFEIFRMGTDGSDICQVTEDSTITSNGTLNLAGNQAFFNDPNNIYKSNLNQTTVVKLTPLLITNALAPNFCPDGTLLFLTSETLV